MSFLQKLMVTTCAFVTMGLTTAHAETKEESAPKISEKTLRALTSCDATFFQELHKEVDAWRALAPMASAGDVSWIRVPSRFAVSGDESQNTVDFNTPPSIGGMELRSYFENVSDLGSLGLIYEWGFLISGDVAEVARKIRPLVRDANRFTALPSGDYVRVEIRSLDSTQWRPTTPEPGVAPTLSKIERAFIVEGVENKPHIARVYCSLQGGVKPDTLKELRPDIESKYYPAKQPEEVSFANTPVPDGVLAAVKLAASNKDLWKPKFKDIKITFGEMLTLPPNATNNQWQNSQNKSIRILAFKTIKMIALKNGLIDVTEEDLNGLIIQRQTFAGLIPLKWHQNKFTDGRTKLATDLNVLLPEKPAGGSSLSYETQVATYPIKAGDNILKLSDSCIASASIDTTDMFPAIQGEATPFICNDNQGNGQVSVYLEDLGVFITVAYGSKAVGWATRKITSAIEVNR